MARVFIDGFEAGHFQGFSSAGTGATIVDAQAGPPSFKNAGHAYKQTSGNLVVSLMRDDFSNYLQEIYISFKWYASSGGYVNQSLVTIETYFTISTDGGGQIVVTKYDSSTVNTGVYIGSGREYRFGVYFNAKYWDDGAYSIYVDGVEVYAETGIQTCTTTAGIDDIRFGSTQYYDDIVIDDSEMPGYTIIAPLTVTSDGYFKQFTPSTGTDLYALVDDATPSIADYISETHAGNIATFGVSALPVAAKQIKSIQVNTFAVIDGTVTGIDMVRPVVYSGGTLHRGAYNEAGTYAAGYRMPAYQWSANPATGEAWSVSELATIQVGLQYELAGGIGTVDDLYLWVHSSSIYGVADGADFGGTTNGPWHDLSGNGLHPDRSAFGPLRPSYHANVQNGLPAVYFADTESMRVYFYERETEKTDVTAVFVCANDSAGTTYDTILDIPGPTGDRLIFAMAAAAAGRAYVWDGQWRMLGSSLTGWHIYTYRCSQEDGARLYIDGVAGDIVTPFDRRALGGIGIIGANYTADGAGWPGYLGEMALYTRALDADELAGIHAALGTKWGITV